MNDNDSLKRILCYLELTAWVQLALDFCHIEPEEAGLFFAEIARDIDKLRR